MIDAIGGGNLRPPPPPRSGENQELSEDQKSIIEDTLSGFDSDNLSEEDALAITQAFSEAGINPSSSFAEALAENGFDAREIGTLANVGPEAQSRPPAPQNKEQANTTLDLSSILTYLEEVAGDNQISTSDLAAKFGLPEGQSLINETV